MTLAAAKQKLHEYVDKADSKKVKAILTLLENDDEPDYEFSDADLKEVDKRWDDYLSGKTKSIPVNESKKRINSYIAHKRKNGL